MTEVFFTADAAKQVEEMSRRDERGVGALLDLMAAETLPAGTVHRLNRSASPAAIFSIRADGLRAVFLEKLEQAVRRRYVLKLYEARDLARETPAETDAVLKMAVSAAETA